ncbi:MAG: class I SAM-dependent methyltransferase [Pseudobdellovibrionaceae bacterium]
MSRVGEIVELFPKKFSTKPVLALNVIEQIRSGKAIEETEFDQIFPPYYQFQSTIHWSSIEVARQISEWINPLNRKSLVDIGCGVGKLCLLLRILTNYEIFGIEQRPKLVEIANKIIKVNCLKNISITQMNMLDLNWDLHDIYYLYNPFQEHIADEDHSIIEKDIEFDAKNYAHYTSEVFRQLTLAKPGKVLITFHGYGGRVPSSWRMVASRHMENGNLTMWVKE